MHPNCREQVLLLSSTDPVPVAQAPSLCTVRLSSTGDFLRIGMGDAQSCMHFACMPVLVAVALLRWRQKELMMLRSVRSQQNAGASPGVFVMLFAAAAAAGDCCCWFCWQYYCGGGMLRSKRVDQPGLCGL